MKLETFKNGLEITFMYTLITMLISAPITLIAYFQTGEMAYMSFVAIVSIFADIIIILLIITGIITKIKTKKEVE